MGVPHLPGITPITPNMPDTTHRDTTIAAANAEAPLTGSLTCTLPETVPMLNPRAAAPLLKLLQDAKARLDAR
jgi:hypothetical protein